MAELIPLEYRIRKARATLISRWIVVSVVTTVAAGTALFSVYLWRHQQAVEFAGLERQYRDQAVQIKQYNDLKARRDDLAARMRYMDDLRSDTILLSLLNNVSSCFSSADSLNYVCVDAHPPERRPGDPNDAAPPKYSIRISGITVDDTSHSHLLERLTATGKKSDPPIKVPLGEKHLMQMLDGAVTSFDITCDQPLAKGD
jgi:hypothetical protein